MLVHEPQAPDCTASVATSRTFQHQWPCWLATDTLAQLAKDLSSPINADREVAVSMLSNLTIYLEHHDVLQRAGVFPALMRAVMDHKIVPQVPVRSRRDRAY